MRRDGSLVFGPCRRTAGDGGPAAGACYEIDMMHRVRHCEGRYAARGDPHP